MGYGSPDSCTIISHKRRDCLTKNLVSSRILMPGFLLSLQRLMCNFGGGKGRSWRELLRSSVFFFFNYLALYPFLSCSPYLPGTPSLHAASTISDPLVTCSIYSPVTHPRYMQHLLASDPLVTCSLHYQWHPPYMQHLLTRDPLLTGSLYLPVTHSVHIASAHQCEDFRKEMELSILCDWNCRGFSIDGMQLFNLDCSQSQHSCDCSASFVFL